MSLLIILFKINLSLLVFYLVYRLALRKLTFFNFNRVYLLSAIAISAMIPFLEYSTTARSQIQSMQAATGIYPYGLVLPQGTSTGINITELALSFYWAGVIIMGAIFLTQLASLIAFYSRTRKDQVSGQSIRTSEGPVSPFSFFGSIFVNPREHSPEALQHILAHESVHVRQWHSLDILAGELKRIFCWFNPAAWLLLRAIRENLEFIADRKVLQNGTDARQYQYALLATQQSSRSHPLSNNFNISHLKFRITMMNRSKSSDMQVLKYLLAVPAVTGLLLLTGFTQAKEKQELSAPVTQSSVHSDFTQAGVQLYNEVADTSRWAPPAPPAAPAAPAPPMPPVPPPPPPHPIPGIDKNNTTVFINGKQSDIDPETIDPGDIKEMTVYRTGSDKRNSSTKIHITTKGHQVTKDKIGQPVVFVDGKRYEKDLATINPKTIKSMNVIKDEQRIRDYDATIRTDQGLIVITTYDGDKHTSNQSALPPFTVYPNPASAQWTIQVTKADAGDRYELFDKNGNKKATGRLTQNTQLSAETLPGGIYFLKLRIAGKDYETRLEKQAN